MKDEKKAVLIIAENPLANQIRKNLKNDDGVEIVADPENHDHLTESIRESAPHVGIFDIDLPGFEWITLVQELKSSISELSIIVLATSCKKADVLSAFREGADAFLLKETLPEQLVAALDTVRRGSVYFSHEISQLIRDHMLFLELGSAKNVTKIQDGIAKLTAREKEVFVLLADGKSVKVSASLLGLSPKTVETHKYHIMEKLNFRTMADFTKLAMIKDLIPL